MLNNMEIKQTAHWILKILCVMLIQLFPITYDFSSFGGSTMQLTSFLFFLLTVILDTKCLKSSELRERVRAVSHR